MALSRSTRVNLLLGNGHFLSHFYSLCLPPLFLAWQAAFQVSFAELGLAVALMAGASATLQTPVGFLVDRYGARPFLIGGALLIVGLQTRLVAFIISGEMAFAYFIAHAPKSFYPLINGGTLAIMFCFTCLFLATAGPGPWSVDAAMKRA